MGGRDFQPPDLGRRRLDPVIPQLEGARWSVDGQSLLSPPAVGDTVALHRDWVCGVLTADQADRMQRLEAAQRTAVGLSGLSPRTG